MDQSSLIELLGQVSESEAGGAFRELLRRPVLVRRKSLLRYPAAWASNCEPREYRLRHKFRSAGMYFYF